MELLVMVVQWITHSSSSKIAQFPISKDILAIIDLSPACVTAHIYRKQESSSRLAF